MQNYVLRLDQVGMDDIEKVGGKNASLGEMLQELSGAHVKVPNGFATTALAYKEFLTHGGLEDQIKDKLDQLDTNNIQNLKDAGKAIRDLIMNAEFQPQLNSAIEAAWAEMSKPRVRLPNSVTPPPTGLNAYNSRLSACALSGLGFLRD